jgi:hypothetical protein
MDPMRTAAAAAGGKAIEALGGIWMLHPEQFARSLEAGFDHPFEGYFTGRAGALGHVQPEVAAATLAVFEPALVVQMWTAGTFTHAPRAAAALYTAQAAQWARDHLSEASDLDRFNALCERVTDAAPSAGLPLFAGWRSLSRADDSTGRALQNALVLRELQGGIHLAALATAGLGPVQAHLLNQGEEYCAFFGWAAPYPSVATLRSAYAEVNQQTERRMASIIAQVLDTAEAGELATLSELLHAQALKSAA